MQNKPEVTYFMIRNFLKRGVRVVVGGPVVYGIEKSPRDPEGIKSHTAVPYRIRTVVVWYRTVPYLTFHYPGPVP